MTGFWIALYAAQWAAIVLLALVLLGVLRHVGTLYQQIHQLIPLDTTLNLGEKIGDVSVREVTGDGAPMPLHTLLHSPTFLLIVTNGCGGCHTLLARLPQLLDSLRATDWQFLVVSQSSAAATRDLVGSLPAGTVSLHVVVDEAATLTREHQIRATPFAIAVDGNGTVLAFTAGPTEEWFRTAASGGRTSEATATGTSRPTESTPVALLVAQTRQEKGGIQQTNASR